MQAEPLIEWPKPVLEFLGFAATFLAAGAVGFRYSALRGRLALSSARGGGATAAAEHAMFSEAARRAAIMGLIGTIISAGLLATALPAMAARAHGTVGGLIAQNRGAQLQVGMLLLAITGFALATARVAAGWPLAALGVVVGLLRAALLGQWARLINPIHLLAASLWIGTLLVLVVAGLSVVLRDEAARDRRGAITAEMVNAFSPLALAAGGTLVLFGVITAWRHLKYVAALWTTPYGWTLIAKLCVVAVVFALGAWNWRRRRPALGSEAAALGIRRSATAELTAAALVLAITAVLVSLPAPKAP
ncbi:MAG TPA: CopD family protein [Gemmatimonadaceae bacterium]|nr:CopD family protein [Gemmatimonadaceae bacterium]